MRVTRYHPALCRCDVSSEGTIGRKTASSVLPAARHALVSMTGVGIAKDARLAARSVQALMTGVRVAKNAQPVETPVQVYMTGVVIDAPFAERLVIQWIP